MRRVLPLRDSEVWQERDYGAALGQACGHEQRGANLVAAANAANAVLDAGKPRDAAAVRDVEKHYEVEVLHVNAAREQARANDDLKGASAQVVDAALHFHRHGLSRRGRGVLRVEERARGPFAAEQALELLLDGHHVSVLLHEDHRLAVAWAAQLQQVREHRDFEVPLRHRAAAQNARRVDMRHLHADAGQLREARLAEPAVAVAAAAERAGVARRWLRWREGEQSLRPR